MVIFKNKLSLAFLLIMETEARELLDALQIGEECNFFEWVSKNEAIVREYISFAQSHNKIKVSTRSIPNKVRLPKTLRNGITIQDVQVSGRRREPDDAIYAGNEKIRRWIARGNTILTFKKDGETHVSFPLYGMKKFTGGMGDDDDQEAGGDNVTWKKFFTKNIQEATESR